MTITSKQRADLRAQAHHLNATVHVGHHGLTPAVIQSLGDALTHTELVKIAFTKTADLDIKASAGDIARSVEADVVQVIGRTVTVFRKLPEKMKSKGG